jgi:hypothetical protein
MRVDVDEYLRMRVKMKREAARGITHVRGVWAVAQGPLGTALS